MEFELSRYLVSKSQPVPLTKDQYEKIVEAKQQLSGAFQLTENYQVLLENYKSIETVKFSLETDCLLYRYDDYRTSTVGSAKLNAPILGFLSTARYFLDSLWQVLKKLMNTAEQRAVKEFISEVYDRSLEYRFMEGLRNHSQHHSLPLRRFTVNLKSDLTEGRYTALSIRLLIAKKELEKAGKIKQSVLELLPEKIDLLYAIRVYLSKLSAIWFHVDSLTSDRVKLSRNLIDTTKDFYMAETKLPSSGLVATHFNENGEVIHREDILTDWDDERKLLGEKFHDLKNFSTLYISGKIAAWNNINA